MTDETRHLVLEMSIGMLVYEVVLGILAVIFRGSLAHRGLFLGPVLLGLLAGFVADVFMLIHMANVAEAALDSMDEAYAKKTTMAQFALRRVVFIIALFVLGSLPQIDAVAMIIGAFGLKAGAFLQPVVHRTFFPDKSDTREEGINEERRMVYGNDENSDGASGG